MRNFAIAFVAVMGLMVAGSAASEAGYGYYGGYGNYGGQGIDGGYGYNYSTPIYHNTSHWDYHPGQFVQHGNHYHYQPGHYDYHQTGHFDTYHNGHIHHHGH